MEYNDFSQQLKSKLDSLKDLSQEQQSLRGNLLNKIELVPSDGNFQRLTTGIHRLFLNNRSNGSASNPIFWVLYCFLLEQVEKHNDIPPSVQGLKELLLRDDQFKTYVEMESKKEIEQKEKNLLEQIQKKPKQPSSAEIKEIYKELNEARTLCKLHSVEDISEETLSAVVKFSMMQAFNAETEKHEKLTIIAEFMQHESPKLIKKVLNENEDLKNKLEGYGHDKNGFFLWWPDEIKAVSYFEKLSKFDGNLTLQNIKIISKISSEAEQLNRSFLSEKVEAVKKDTKTRLQNLIGANLFDRSSEAYEKIKFFVEAKNQLDIDLDFSSVEINLKNIKNLISEITKSKDSYKEKIEALFFIKQIIDSRVDNTELKKKYNSEIQKLVNTVFIPSVDDVIKDGRKTLKVLQDNFMQLELIKRTCAELTKKNILEDKLNSGSLHITSQVQEIYKSNPIICTQISTLDKATKELQQAVDEENIEKLEEKVRSLQLLANEDFNDNKANEDISSGFIDKHKKLNLFLDSLRQLIIENWTEDYTCKKKAAETQLKIATDELNLLKAKALLEEISEKTNEFKSRLEQSLSVLRNFEQSEEVDQLIKNLGNELKVFSSDQMAEKQDLSSLMQEERTISRSESHLSLSINSVSILESLSKAKEGIDNILSKYAESNEGIIEFNKTESEAINNKFSQKKQYKEFEGHLISIAKTFCNKGWGEIKSSLSPRSKFVYCQLIDPMRAAYCLYSDDTEKLVNALSAIVEKYGTGINVDIISRKDIESHKQQLKAIIEKQYPTCFESFKKIENKSLCKSIIASIPDLSKDNTEIQFFITKNYENWLNQLALLYVVNGNDIPIDTLSKFLNDYLNSVPQGSRSNFSNIDVVDQLTESSDYYLNETKNEVQKDELITEVCDHLKALGANTKLQLESLLTNSNESLPETILLDGLADLKELPEAFTKRLGEVKSLTIKNCGLKQLPAELSELAPKLETLKLLNNTALDTLPELPSSLQQLTFKQHACKDAQILINALQTVEKAKQHESNFVLELDEGHEIFFSQELSQLALNNTLYGSISGKMKPVLGNREEVIPGQESPSNVEVINKLLRALRITQAEESADLKNDSSITKDDKNTKLATFKDTIQGENFTLEVLTDLLKLMVKLATDKTISAEQTEVSLLTEENSPKYNIQGLRQMRLERGFFGSGLFSQYGNTTTWQTMIREVKMAILKKKTFEMSDVSKYASNEELNTLLQYQSGRVKNPLGSQVWREYHGIEKIVENTKSCLLQRKS